MLYGFEVVYKRQDNTSGAVSGGDGSIQDANKGVTYHIDYYKNLGYTITTATVNTFCETCKGAGKVFKAKRKGMMAFAHECPTCKGKGIVESLTLEF